MTMPKKTRNRESESESQDGPSIAKNAESSATPSIAPVAEETSPQKMNGQARDERPPFIPRTSSEKTATSVSIPLLADGTADIDKMREGTLEKLRTAVSSRAARQKLGLAKDESQQSITAEIAAGFLGFTGMIEGAAVSFIAKIPPDVAMPLMQYSDDELNAVAPLMAEVLEEQAPAWLRRFLLSSNAKMGQLGMLLFQIHRQKLALIKQWKAENPQGQPKQVPVQ